MVLMEDKDKFEPKVAQRKKKTWNEIRLPNNAVF